jgi:[ribosomal protein S5]-alanine N-acetyltransferase
MTEPYYWQSEHIRLRPMHVDDVALWLAEERSYSETVRMLNAGMDLPKSEQDARAFAERYAEFNHRHERIMFSIETLDGELVGGINVHSMNQRNGTFETGTRIYRAYRGRGYGFEAKLLVLRYAFHELRFQKYNIRCLETNQPMIDHAARLGCQPEGRIRRHNYTNGRYYDDLLFGLTREEFDALEERLAVGRSPASARTRTSDDPIATERLTIRRFRPEDADDLFEYLSDPQIYRFEPGEPTDCAQASQRAVEMAASTDFWAIELAAAGKVIGQLYFQQIEPAEHLTCELGFILNPAYQRQGYGSEAAGALVQRALTSDGTHRVVAHCNPENNASWKLLEKIGFRREGLLRQNAFFRRSADGQPLWTDTYVYARLAADVQRVQTL